MKVSDGLQFRCYIDESGDEGFVWRERGGSTRWFVMAAVILRESEDLAVARATDRIKSRLNLEAERPLHWVDRRRHEQRRVIVDEIQKEPITVVCVALHKPSLGQSYLRTPPALYHYSTRLLLERVSWFVAAQSGHVDLVFENRTTVSYGQLEAYIRALQADPKVQIRSVIGTFQTVTRAQQKILQIADACAGAMFAALECDQDGLTDQTYIEALSSRLYRHGASSKLVGYGIKIFPDPVRERPEFAWSNGL